MDIKELNIIKYKYKYKYKWVSKRIMILIKD